MIECRACGELKPPEDFNKMKRSKTGRQTECRACAKLRMKAWYDDLSPGVKKERQAYRIQHRRDNAEMYYWHRIRYVYNLSREQFEHLLRAQDGVCGICRTDLPGGRSGRWNVDHDHACCEGDKSCGGCVRGLLCNACNHGLGNFRDDVESLGRAIEYLRGIPHD